MLYITLELWAGGFYLFNKIFFLVKEISFKKRKWRIWSWSVYLIGLPAWFLIFVFERNWIAAGLEAGGAPSMLLGLFLAVYAGGDEKKENPRWLRWLDWFALITITAGALYSLHDFGGITTLNQWLEIFMVLGFLFGTYMLAKDNAKGYLWFLLMNGSNACLMYIQDHPYLVLQQLASFCIVYAAFAINVYRNGKK